MSGCVSVCVCVWVGGCVSVCLFVCLGGGGKEIEGETYIQQRERRERREGGDL